MTNLVTFTQSSSFYRSEPFSRLKKETLIHRLIREVALSSLKELACGLAMTGMTCCFVATAAIPGLWMTAISIVAFNTLFRCGSAYLEYKIQQLKHSRFNESDRIKDLEKCQNFLQFICPISFSGLDQMTTSVLTHEAGHALAAAAVYEHANPRIEIFPGKGGMTTFNPSALTHFGKWLGPKLSAVFTILAGPVAGIFSATALLGLSHYLQDNHPRLSLYLQISAVVNIVQHVFYALSALGQKASSMAGHDFVMLWKIGHIHPIIAAISMAALPILVKVGLLALKNRHRHQAVGCR